MSNLGILKYVKLKMLSPHGGDCNWRALFELKEKRQQELSWWEIILGSGFPQRQGEEKLGFSCSDRWGTALSGFSCPESWGRALSGV